MYFVSCYITPKPAGSIPYRLCLFVLAGFWALSSSATAAYVCAFAAGVNTDTETHRESERERHAHANTRFCFECVCVMSGKKKMNIARRQKENAKKGIRKKGAREQYTKKNRSSLAPSPPRATNCWITRLLSAAQAPVHAVPLCFCFDVLFRHGRRAVCVSCIYAV